MKIQWKLNFNPVQSKVSTKLRTVYFIPKLQDDFYRFMNCYWTEIQLRLNCYIEIHYWCRRYCDVIGSLYGRTFSSVIEDASLLWTHGENIVIRQTRLLVQTNQMPKYCSFASWSVYMTLVIPYSDIRKLSESYVIILFLLLEFQKPD